ncbi:MAG: hypothetical protein M0Q21_05205 [Ignavibacteriaceae bacterium]|nr:hypothetical protein [Ignavibacteriaceae bacterium]
MTGLTYINDMFLQIKYRPIRLGICVLDDDLDSILNAMRINYSLWGGIYNPIIPVNDEKLADYLIKLFRVDILYPIIENKKIEDFIKKYNYLQWPFNNQSLYTQSQLFHQSVLLDIETPAQMLSESQKLSGIFQLMKKGISFFDIEKNDKLKNFYLMSFGELPNIDRIKIDYQENLTRYFTVDHHLIEPQSKIEYSYFDLPTIKNLCGYNLFQDSRNAWGFPGIYFGKLENALDLINYWNLQATSIPIYFYDSNYREIFGDFINVLCKDIVNHDTSRFRAYPRNVGIYYSNDSNLDLDLINEKSIKIGVNSQIWNGLNVSVANNYINSKFIHSTAVAHEYGEKCSIQLPDKGFNTLHTKSGQNLICVIRNVQSHFSTHQTISYFANYPEVNSFLGDKCFLDWREARSGYDGLGKIIDIHDDHISFYSIQTEEYLIKVFEAFGVDAQISKPGLIANRIINQFDGIQGCRVFKIAGVRNLFGKSKPDESLKKTSIIETICELPLERKDEIKRFSEKYNDLTIYSGQKRDLNPDGVFNFLLEKGAFRVGIDLKCPKCGLDFWLDIDSIRSVSPCYYCGHIFNIYTQIKDNNWSYRRSGIFGKDDNQEGSIPVIVTLQQLHTTLHAETKILYPSMKLTLKGQKKEFEIDFVMILQEFNNKPKIIFGECKSRGGKIEQQDVDNLVLFANKIPQDRFDVFLLFSKLNEFTSEEINCCKKVNNNTACKLIMLTDRELEPYHLYSRTIKEFPNIDKHTISLEQMVANTHKMYYEFENEKD